MLNFSGQYEKYNMQNYLDKQSIMELESELYNYNISKIWITITGLD